MQHVYSSFTSHAFQHNSAVFSCFQLWGFNLDLIRVFLAFMAPAPVPSAVIDQVLTYGVENVEVCKSARGKSSLPTCSVCHKLLRYCRLTSLAQHQRCTGSDVAMTRSQAMAGDYEWSLGLYKEHAY